MLELYKEKRVSWGLNIYVPSNLLYMLWREENWIWQELVFLFIDGGMS